MVTRKVQLTGSSTYTISLPKEWARSHGIEPGMQLTLCPGHNGELVIGAGQTAGERAPTLDVESIPVEAIQDVVRGLYAVGADRFTLSTSGTLADDVRRAIGDATSDLVGLEITRETDESVQLTTPLDASELGIESTLVQLQYVALSMQSDAITALMEDDVELSVQVTERRRDARRKCHLVSRAFQRSLTDLEELRAFGRKRPRVFDYHVVADRLDRVAEQAERIATLAAGRTDTAAWDGAQTYASSARTARNLVDEGVDVLLSADDPVAAFEVMQSCDDLTESLDQLDPDPAALRLAIESLKRTATCARDIANRALQASLRDTQG